MRSDDLTVEYQEFNDEQHAHSLARADHELKVLVNKLTAITDLPAKVTV